MEGNMRQGNPTQTEEQGQRGDTHHLWRMEPIKSVMTSSTFHHVREKSNHNGQRRWFFLAFSGWLQEKSSPLNPFGSGFPLLAILRGSTPRCHDVSGWPRWSCPLMARSSSFFLLVLSCLLQRLTRRLSTVNPPPLLTGSYRNRLQMTFYPSQHGY